MSCTTANIVSYSHGFGVGWLSLAIPALKADDTPLESGPLSLQQESWLGGSYPLGALTGEILFAMLLNLTNLKISMMALAIPNLVQ